MLWRHPHPTCGNLQGVVGTKPQTTIPNPNSLELIHAEGVNYGMLPFFGFLIRPVDSTQWSLQFNLRPL
jgi:hypothetical protein